MRLRQLALVPLAVGLALGGALVQTPVGLGSFAGAAESPGQRVVALVNVERAKRGLAPLAVSRALSTSANAYAREMATERFFSHVGPNGSTLVSRDEAAGYRDWWCLEEDIAAGQTTPEQVVAAWMASYSHRENILSSQVREIGAGWYALPGSPYGFYWVIDMGRRS
jgi:uncharacterized protein YkwD